MERQGTTQIETFDAYLQNAEREKRAPSDLAANETNSILYFIQHRAIQFLLSIRLPICHQ